MNLDSMVIIAGCGGLAGQLVKLLELRSVPKNRRPQLRDPLYWLTFPIYAILGGFVGWIYLQSEAKLTAFLALQVGVSAPLIISGFLNSVPPRPIDPGKDA